VSRKYQRRASDLIQRHLTELLKTRVNDPRVRMVTITGVETNADTTQAQVYFSVLGGQEVQQEALAGLESATGFLRWELGQRIRLRNTPELIFHYDASLERGERISNILDQLKTDDSTSEPEPE
jgi:ribosome-binding factor A